MVAILRYCCEKFLILTIAAFLFGAATSVDTSNISTFNNESRKNTIVTTKKNIPLVRENQSKGKSWLPLDTIHKDVQFRRTTERIPGDDFSIRRPAVAFYPHCWACVWKALQTANELQRPTSWIFKDCRNENIKQYPLNISYKYFW